MRFSPFLMCCWIRLLLSTINTLSTAGRDRRKTVKRYGIYEIAGPYSVTQWSTFLTTVETFWGKVLSCLNGMIIILLLASPTFFFKGLRKENFCSWITVTIWASFIANNTQMCSALLGATTYKCTSCVKRLKNPGTKVSWPLTHSWWKNRHAIREGI